MTCSLIGSSTTRSLLTIIVSSKNSSPVQLHEELCCPLSRPLSVPLHPRPFILTHLSLSTSISPSSSSLPLPTYSYFDPLYLSFALSLIHTVPRSLCSVLSLYLALHCH